MKTWLLKAIRAGALAQADGYVAPFLPAISAVIPSAAWQIDGPRHR